MGDLRIWHSCIIISGAVGVVEDRAARDVKVGLSVLSKAVMVEATQEAVLRGSISIGDLRYPDVGFS